MRGHVPPEKDHCFLFLIYCRMFRITAAQGFTKRTQGLGVRSAVP